MNPEDTKKLLVPLMRIADALEKIAGRSAFEQVFGKDRGL